MKWKSSKEYEEDIKEFLAYDFEKYRKELEDQKDHPIGVFVLILTLGTAVITTIKFIWGMRKWKKE